MLIAIPSKARATRQVTLRSLPREIRDKVYVVVEPQDAHSYGFLECNLLVLPENNRGLWFARQWLLDYCCAKGETKVFMMDDDLTFARRRDDSRDKFTTPTDPELLLAFDTVDQQLDKYDHVAIAPREGGNRRTEDYILNTRAMRAHGHRVDKLAEYGLRYTNDQAHMIEDFTMELSLLLLGRPHYTINWMVTNQSGSNTTGGCSTYRTMEAQERAAYALKAKFPNFVQVVKKKTKTAWGGQERTDVVIAWKKAYEWGVAHARKD